MDAGSDAETARRVWRILASPHRCQALLDGLQAVLGEGSGARIVVLPVAATLPRPAPEEEEAEAKVAGEITRQALYESVAKSAPLDPRYLLMVIPSTVVTAIGLNENSVAIVIDAMVIAPLLGPNLALALATALGHGALMYRAMTTGLIGLLAVVLLSFLIGLAWPPDLGSEDLMARTRAGLDSIALALASGAAATLSLTAAVPTTLVGVMVALLLPTATIGLMLGGGHLAAAFGALLLLAVNTVCVNLAVKLAFVIRGVRPRTWYEKRKASQSMKLYIDSWIVPLAILVIAMLLWRQGMA